MELLEPVFRSVPKVQAVPVVPLSGHWQTGHDGLYRGEGQIGKVDSNYFY